MAWTLLADGVLVLHACWVAAAVLLPLAAVRRPRWRAVHLLLLGLTVAFAAALGSCPLTWLEDGLRARAGLPPGADGFVARWAERLVYWDVPQAAAGTAAGLWLALWAAVYHRLRRRERAAPSGRAGGPGL